jgi:hypothetical protein
MALELGRRGIEIFQVTTLKRRLDKSSKWHRPTVHELFAKRLRVAAKVNNQ